MLYIACSVDQSLLNLVFPAVVIHLHYHMHDTMRPLHTRWVIFRTLLLPEESYCIQRWCNWRECKDHICNMFGKCKCYTCLVLALGLHGVLLLYIVILQQYTTMYQ